MYGGGHISSIEHCLSEWDSTVGSENKRDTMQFCNKCRNVHLSQKLPDYLKVRY